MDRLILKRLRLSAFSGKSDNLNKLRFAFNIYDIDRDGYGNGELFIVMKMMVGKI